MVTKKVMTALGLGLSLTLTILLGLVYVSPAAARPAPAAEPAPVAVPLNAVPLLTHTVQLTPNLDTSLYEESGNLSNGQGDYLFIGVTASGNGNNIRRALLAFDVAGAVPPGATIVSATLRLKLSKNGPAGSEPATLHRLQTDWGEGSSDAGGEEGGGTTATAGDATWTHAISPSTTWATPGGDFVSTASATTTVGISEGSPYAWSAAGMVSDVQSWLDSPATNFGWVLRGNEASPSTAKRFDSRENPLASDQPLLTIVYRPLAAVIKTVDDSTPEPGQVVTYTIVVQNNDSGNLTNATISDTLPLSFTLAATPILDPPGAGTVGSGPVLVSGLTITAGTQVTVTFPVTVGADIASGSQITNTAAMTSTEVVTPVTGAVLVTVGGQQQVFLPIVLKN